MKSPQRNSKNAMGITVITFVFAVVLAISSATAQEKKIVGQRDETATWIPQDLSAIGFDNVRISQYVLPPLTTVEISQTELARTAFEALLSDVQGKFPSASGTEYVLKTNLVLRDITVFNSH